MLKETVYRLNSEAREAKSRVEQACALIHRRMIRWFAGAGDGPSEIEAAEYESACENQNEARMVLFDAMREIGVSEQDFEALVKANATDVETAKILIEVVRGIMARQSKAGAA